MSRNPDDYTNERRTAVALERIADTLDDYMDLTLSAQHVTTIGLPREALERLAPLLDEITTIRLRRGNR